MAESNVSNFGPALKKVYSDTVVKFVPENAVLQRLINFKKNGQGVGDAFVWAVKTAQDQAMKFAGANQVFQLPDAIPGAYAQASAVPYQFATKAEIGWELQVRAMAGNSKQSFIDATKDIVSDLADNVRRKIEIQLLYGGVEKGVVGSVSGNNITIKESDYAAYLWADCEGTVIDVYVGSTGVRRCTTTITGHVAGTTTGVITVADATGITANDTIYWEGERGNTWSGIHKVATTVGNLYGIDNTNLGKWQGNSYAVGGALTMGKLEASLLQAVNKGFTGDATVLVSPAVWSNMMLEQAAKRMYTGDQNAEYKNGVKALTFAGVTGGVMRVIASPFVKNGYGYIINEDDYLRFGPTEFQLGPPGRPSELIPSTNVTADILVGYGCQGLACFNPSRTTVLTGITVGSF